MASYYELLDAVRIYAQPFGPQVNDTIANIEKQWSDLELSLNDLALRYQSAVTDWKAIQSDFDSILTWTCVKLDWSQRSVNSGEETETLAQIQVRNY